MNAPTGSTGAVATSEPTGPAVSTVVPPAHPATPTCPAHAVFCEDFESGFGDRWETNGDGVVIDSALAFDGSHSLHVQIGHENGRAISGAQTARIKLGIPTTSDRLYVRAYVRFGELSLPGFHPNYINVIGGTDDFSKWPDGFASLSFGAFLGEFSINAFTRGFDAGKLWVEEGTASTDKGDATPSSEHGLSAGEWLCLELMAFGDDSGADDHDHSRETFDVSFDGVFRYRADDAYYTGFWGSSVPEHWSPLYDGSKWTFGIDGQYTDALNTDIWFDAIAFSEQPVGCAD